MLVRRAVVWLVPIALAASVGCNVKARYVPDPGLHKQNAAVLHVRDPHVGGFSGSTALDVYDFATGCPDITLRLRSTGYRGSITLNSGSDPQATIPAKKLVLKLDWTQITPWFTRNCISAVTFTPKAGSDYLVVYGSPAAGGNECAVAIVKIVRGPSGEELEEVEDATGVRFKQTFGGRVPVGLCSGRS
jgi:hypothetical protein